MTTIARAVSVTIVAVLGLVAAATVALALFGGQLAALAIEKGGSALLGRTVAVGSVTLDWGRYTTVSAQDLRVAALPWSPQPDMLRIARSEATFDLWDLLRLQLTPDRVRLDEPVLHLVRNRQGEWNLPRQDAGSSGGKGHDLLARLAALRSIVINEGQLSLNSLASPVREAEVRDFALDLQEGAERIGFSGMARLRGGGPVPFTGRLGSPSVLLRSIRGEATRFPVQLQVGSDAARLAVEGSLGDPLNLADAELRLDGQGDSLAPLLGAFGVRVEPTPPFRLAAQARLDGGHWTLRDLEARLGSSTLQGSASLRRNPARPQISFDFVSPRIDTADFDWLGAAGADQGAGTPQPERGPVAWLRQLDAEGGFEVQKLVGPPGPSLALRTRINLKDGRLQADPLHLEAGEGTAQGAATLTADESGPPKSSLRLEARNLPLAAVLAPLGIGRLTGRLGTASVDLQAQGATLNEVLAALDGHARFRIAEGHLDLSGLSHISMGLMETLGVVLGGTGQSAPTPLTCVVAELPVRQGVVQTERLVVQIPQVVITGEGRLQLNSSRLHLTLTPHPTQDALLRVVVPVVVSGTLDAPEVTRHPELRLDGDTATAAQACAP